MAVERDFINQLNEHIHNLANQPHQFKELLKKGEQYIKRIKKKKPEQYSEAFRMLAVEFFVIHYTRRMSALGPSFEDIQKFQQNPEKMPIPEVDPKLVEEFKNDQTLDMEFAWLLLSSKFTGENKVKAAATKIEICQRLENAPKLEKAVNELKDIIENGKLPLLQKQQLTPMLFTSLAHLGRWKEFLKIGDTFNESHFMRFSAMSADLPLPDYSLLYETAKKEKAHTFPQLKPEELVWEMLHLKSIRVKFRDLDCEEFTAKRDELLKEIRQDEENTNWEDVPKPSRVHLRRVGCVLQCMSFSENPQQLCGIDKKDHIQVSGKVQVFVPNEKNKPSVNEMEMMSLMQNQQLINDLLSSGKLEMLIQEESWDIKRDAKDKDLFTGTYKMHHYHKELPGSKKNKDPDKAPLHMTFDLEMRFCTEEEAKRLEQNPEKEEEKQVEKIVTEFDGIELE